MINFAMDQAVGLRRLLKPAGVRVLPVFGPPERLFAIVNLATAAARTGQQVLVVDASRGEIAPAFGLSARYELKHVLEGEVAFRDAALRTGDGVWVLPAARGIRMLAEARVGGLDFFESLAEQAAPVDLIIVNCETEDRATRLLPGHGEVLLVLPCEPNAIVEAAARMKALAAQHAIERFRVLMTGRNFDEARQAVNALAQITDDRMNIDLVFGGSVPPDRRLRESSRVRRTIFDLDPAGSVARAFQNAAAGMMDWDLTVVTPACTTAGIATGAAHPARAVSKLH